VLSTVTVIHRISYTYARTRHLAPVKETEPIVLKAAREVERPALSPASRG